MINVHSGYFSIGNQLRYVDKWLNPARHMNTVTLRNHPLQVKWTQRAQRQLIKRSEPLFVEMQLYFSCVVKKRVLFHDVYEANATPVNDNMFVTFRPVESTSCDPLEFARHFPVKQEFQSSGAIKMRPKSLLVDFKNGSWNGEYKI